MNKKDLLFEQYKMLFSSAENVSARRQTANQFFLGVNALFLSAAGYLSLQSVTPIHFVFTAMGAIICWYWKEHIQSSKLLNRAKFTILHEMEKKFPVPVFKREWDLLERGRGKKYSKATRIESDIPVVFIFAYVVIAILMLVSML